MQLGDQVTIRWWTGWSNVRTKDKTADAGRGFASNVGLTFKTPEEFFHNATPEPYEKPFDPNIYLHSGPNATDPPLFARQNPLELIIFCGSPGAGKSTFYWNNMEPLGYERVNQDILKTVCPIFWRLGHLKRTRTYWIEQRPKCLKVAREHLTAGKSVAVGMLAFPCTINQSSYTSTRQYLNSPHLSTCIETLTRGTRTTNNTQKR